jgi:hypothetical protein
MSWVRGSMSAMLNSSASPIFWNVGQTPSADKLLHLHPVCLDTGNDTGNDTNRSAFTTDASLLPNKPSRLALRGTTRNRAGPRRFGERGQWMLGGLQTFRNRVALPFPGQSPRLNTATLTLQNHLRLSAGKSTHRVGPQHPAPLPLRSRFRVTLSWTRQQPNNLTTSSLSGWPCSASCVP